MSGGAATARARLASVLATDRAVLAQAPQLQAPVLARVHEAARPSRNRNLARDEGSANRITRQDTRTLRDQARRLERDHDLARGGLDALVQNTVGAGIDVMPAPRLPGQPIDTGLAQELSWLYDAWWELPEVTREHDLGACQQLLARSLYRDGEVLYQDVFGLVPGLTHGTAVPLSLELIEADLLPLDFTDPARGIREGIETNAWGRRLAYHLFKLHPGDPDTFSTETKRASADYVHHLALVDRIGQRRGLSRFASVLNRLADIKDYEDSERVAAKVAASLSAQIVKGSPDAYGAKAGLASGMLVGDEADVRATEYRALTMRPGMIADDLLPGERVEIIDSKRPNPNTETFRTGQLRAAAAGLGLSFSTLARDYRGSYSSQRQELVEQWGRYQMAAEFFIARHVRPAYVVFCQAALAAGLVKLPPGWTLRNLAAASYVRPVMPWIDPVKEVEARAIAEDRGWVPPQKNVLEMGSDPHDVLQQAAEWRAKRAEHGLPDPTPRPAAPAAPQPPAPEADDA